MASRADNRRTNSIESIESIESVAGELIFPEREIGTGAQTLYAYYLPTYRRLAASKGESSWLLKVGVTTDSLDSVVSRQRDLLPEAPAIAIAVRADDAELLQKLVHMVLDLRGRRSPSGGGGDWFVTSGEEIAGIYAFVVGETPVTVPSARSFDMTELSHRADMAELTHRADMAELTHRADMADSADLAADAGRAEPATSRGYEASVVETPVEPERQYWSATPNVLPDQTDLSDSFERLN